jgi:hypothetical protein
MMVELARYRRERGLPTLPAAHEDTPLVLPLGLPASCWPSFAFTRQGSQVQSLYHPPDSRDPQK